MSHETYHLVGIGGAGMSSLARVLHSRGICVTGSDMASSPTLTALQKELRVRLYVGHSEENLGKPDLVIASAAIKQSNPEVRAAVSKRIQVISRAELLGRIMDLYSVRIAVSGTHGKTTTSAMIAQMLAYAGIDPTALIGADVPSWRSNTRIGFSDTIVAESCEAYGSFLELRPSIAVITNIEADHLDYYADFQAIVSAFNQFADQTTDKVIVCADGGADKLLSDRSKLLTYGIEGGEIRARIDSPTRFSVYRNDEELGAISMQVPGTHNILNALAAVAVGLTLGLKWKSIADGIRQFTGTARRFELIAQTDDDIVIVDDYAHHPTEIRATLAAARSKYPARRIVALFQPHLPSRTRDLMDEFAASFQDADQVLVTDIYLAREPAMPGIDSNVLSDKIQGYRDPSTIEYAGSLNKATTLLSEIARPGDLILTLGAGDVRKAAEDLSRRHSALQPAGNI